MAQEGKYPHTSSVCIGAGYNEDWDGDGTIDCHINYLGPANVAHPSAVLDNELQKVAAIPKVDISPVQASASRSLVGYTYLPGVTIDGKAGRVMLRYYLEGLDQNCGLPILGTVTGGFETSNAFNNAPNYIGATRCYIAINEP